MLALACGVALLTLLPLAYVVVDALSLGGAEASRLLFRARVGLLLRNTVLLTAGGMLVCAVLGTALAWVVERTDLRGRTAWTVLLAAPLVVPAFVTSFGWVSLLPRVASPAGALLIVTLAYYPLVFLPVVAALRGLDPALEETSQSLGHREGVTFVRVVLPQLRPALLGGSLLVGLHLLSEFGALQLLRFPTFTTAIYDQYTSSFSGPAASTLAGVLLLLCLLLLVGELRLRGGQRYAKVGAGAARHALRRPLGRAAVPVRLGVAAVVVLGLGVPLGSLLRWLVRGTAEGPSAADLVATTASSLGLGVAAAVVTSCLALPVALLAVRHRSPLTSALERTTYLATALPGIVVALALVTTSLRLLPAVYQTPALLLGAYVLLYLPRASVSLRAALAQAPPALDDVAHTLGAGTWATLRRVVLPVAAPGVLTGAALVFLGVVTELTATLLLAPLGTRTLATAFWEQSSQLAYAAAAPYAALMVVLSAPAVLLLTRELRRTAP